MRQKTKIIATLSEKRATKEFIAELHEAGMDVVRLNTAFQSMDGAREIVANIRAVSDRLAVMIDTKGPEVRTTETAEDIQLVKSERVAVKGNPKQASTRACVCVSYAGFVAEVPLQSRILIDDGALELKVLEKKGDELICEALNDGRVQGRKSVNVPLVNFALPSLSEKDKAFILFAIESGVDFIAHSFVRSADDVLAIQRILDENDSTIKIIAKIENQEGVNRIDEILEHAYGIMVARGDLAIEIPYEKVPGVQRLLINKCIWKRKPVIIATQMLHSMVHNPRPTRAEVSDVANAVYSKADALMLSAETATGDYPLEAVTTMAKVAAEVESSQSDIHESRAVVLTNERSAFLTKTAVQAAIRMDAKAIIADTATGASIRNMACFRGPKPIFAHCYERHIMRHLSLSFGVVPKYTERFPSSHAFVHKALEGHLADGTLNEEDLVVLISGNFGGSFGASFIEICTVDKLIEDKTAACNLP